MSVLKIFIAIEVHHRCIPGADPGFFLGGGAPLRNEVTGGEVKKI